MRQVDRPLSGGAASSAASRSEAAQIDLLGRVESGELFVPQLSVHGGVLVVGAGGPEATEGVDVKRSDLHRFLEPGEARRRKRRPTARALPGAGPRAAAAPTTAQSATASNALALDSRKCPPVLDRAVSGLRPLQPADSLLRALGQLADLGRPDCQRRRQIFPTQTLLEQRLSGSFAQAQQGVQIARDRDQPAMPPG